ncbi:hypothetical protein MTO96_027040 [Rhipicephalus appendiculatus]
MDTTTTRKRLHPSEPGSDDEEASRKLQALGPSSQSELTQSLPSCVAGVAERPSPNAGGSCNESEFRQVLSKAQKRRQRAAMPQGTTGNTTPLPGIGAAITYASRPPASCSGPAGWTQQRGIHWLRSTSSHYCWSKTYAAALGTPATELTNSVNHPKAPLQQEGHLTSGKKRGSAMPSSFQNKAPQSASNENTTLRLLLRVVADLLLPDNQQLRSICLQAGGVLLPSSHHG